MKKLGRRNFLKATGLSALPLFLPLSLTAKRPIFKEIKENNKTKVSFIGDGENLSPKSYLKNLTEIDETNKIGKDSYGNGGAVLALEQAFAKMTGKEAAIFVPTGTLANQLAISQLSGDRTKIFVQDTSHVYRDEADASQSVFHKRLMPLAKEESYFSANELIDAIENLPNKEVFKSGVGAVSIENPVRRKMGTTVPIDEISKISAYCKQNNIGLHLDGARIFLASAWTGISINEYAQYFDTVYISLYKYLGSGGGAILCGDKAFIDEIPHLIKVHGGTIYQNWMNAAMALHKLETIETILSKVVENANILQEGLNRLDGLKVKPLENGTNIYQIAISDSVDGPNFTKKLSQEYGIEMIPFNGNGESILMMNETLLKM